MVGSNVVTSGARHLGHVLTPSPLHTAATLTYFQLVHNPTDPELLQQTTKPQINNEEGGGGDVALTAHI